MIIKSFITPGLAIASYIIFDEITRQGAIIDPTRHIEQYLRYAQQENIDIMYILETHVHADFVSGAQEIKGILNKAKIISSGMGGQEWSPHYADQLINDRDEIQIGSFRLQAWHTPGHTPEHIIWVAFDDRRNSSIPALAFTGDLLFVGSIGRPDLLGHEAQQALAKQLYHSVFQILATLPDFIEIYPAHGAGSLCGKGIGARLSSTLGYERQCNPWLKKLPYEEWVKGLLNDMPAAPPYFFAMKQLNVTGADLSSLPRELPPILTLDQILKFMPTSQIVDIRHPEAFAAGHLKGAINIPLSPSFATWAGSVLPSNKELLIVIGDPSEALFVVQSLKLIGANSIKGVFNTKDQRSQEWENIQHFSPMMSVNNVQAEKENLLILDVRTPGEWNINHIKEAQHLEMPLIRASLDRLPKNKNIAVFCHSGMRASIIASLLRNYGFSASSVRGGMQEWMKAGLPVINENQPIKT